MINREAIYSALFNRLKGLPNINTFSRKLLHWSDVPANQQPAVFLAQSGQVPIQGDPARGLPTKWTLEANIYVYVCTTGEDYPGAMMNPIMDAIEAILAPDIPAIQRTQTLDGLVEHCWIEGAVQTDEGTLGDQAVHIIPIKILAT